MSGGERTRHFLAIPALSALLLAVPAYAQAEQRLFSTTGKMRVEVQDTAGQPLPAAKLQVSVWTNDDNFEPNSDYVCDGAGIAEIALPKEVQIVRIWATAKGHAGMFANIQSQQDMDLTIPAKFAFRLPLGSVMSGRVLDEAGQPIAGVKVNIDYAYQHFKPENFTVPSLSDSETTTDAEGRWRFETIMPGSNVKVRLRLTHPNYVSDKVRQIGGEIARKQGVTEWQMRDGSAVIKMQRGCGVTGKVLDSTGQPVANAVVAWGDDAYARLGSQDTRSKEDGSFQLGAVPAGPTRLTVITDKGMPQTSKVDVDDGLQPLELRLQPSKRLKVRFVDNAGQPVPDVQVRIKAWRGQQSMFHEGGNNLFDAFKPMRADRNGIFEWIGAPDDEVLYTFSANYFALTEAKLTASDDSEHVQILHRFLDISGTVKDATTGQPIDKFLVIPIIHFRPDFPMVERQNAKRRSDGKFSQFYNRTDIEHGLQIEAPGYLIWRTNQRYKMGDPNPKLDVRLQKTAPYIGRVLDANGKPTSGATVYVATSYQHLGLSSFDDRGGQYTSNYFVKSDESGQFEITGQIEPYVIVVVAPTGFAEVRREAGELPGEIQIQPYAKIAGQLMEAGQPVANESVSLSPVRLDSLDQPRVDLRFSAQTGSDGSFSFERVPPVAIRVGSFLSTWKESPLMSSRYVPLQLQPGEQRGVMLGGGGVEIRGQLVVDNSPPGFDYHYSTTYLIAKRPGIEAPNAIAAAGFDWRKGWTEALRESSEGQTFFSTLHTWFVKPTPEGRIRISGVEPGEYELAVNLFGTTEGCLIHPIATRVIPITVKPGDSSLDLGNLAIPSLTLPKVGDLAPDFEFITLAGNHGRLSGLRGRYVLLDFWATWCGQCVTKLGDVELLRERFAVDKKLEVMGLNVDADRSRVETFLQPTKLPWIHVPLGEWSTTAIPRQFAISGIPAYVLIDPSGRITAHENSLEKIEAALHEK